MNGILHRPRSPLAAMRETVFSALLPSLPPARTYLSGVLWNWFVPYAKQKIISSLSKIITKGGLIVKDGSKVYVFGDVESKGELNAAVIDVRSEDFWVRLFTGFDIGFSEAYMQGDFQSPDLKKVINLYIDNVDRMDRMSTWVYNIASIYDVFSRRFLDHGRLRAVENCAGYDASNELYKAFLSKEMQYSCPIWSDDEGGVRGDLEGKRTSGDLEAAQARKIATLLRKARLREGDRLLEIGSGWCGVAITAGKMGCIVDTITLSIEQKRLSDIRIEKEGLKGKVRCHFMDYRDMPMEFEKAFDACISVEMLEAVGMKYMSTYLKQIDWALKDERATVVLSSSAYPECSYTPYQANDFLRKYHWPGGVSPSATSFIDDMHRTLKGRFCLSNLEDIGANYPRCLREWHRRMDENWTIELSESLIDKYPELSVRENMEIFKRKWRYMFIYCEVGYARQWVSMQIWTFLRPGNVAAVCQ